MNRNDFDRAVLDWRRREERASSLGIGELDELEDHLRARAEMEMELGRALEPGRAVMLAAEGLGDGAALGREFAKAGKPRWRRWMGAGWALWAASWWLPTLEGCTQPPIPLPNGEVQEAEREVIMGYEAFWVALTAAVDSPLDRDALPPTASALTNFLIPASYIALRRGRGRTGRRLKWLVAGAALLNLQWLPFGDDLLIGYWVWLASFLCVAAGLWLRGGNARPLESARSRSAQPAEAQ